MTDEQIADDERGVTNTTTLLADWDMDGDFINSANPGTFNGSKVGDIVLTSNYSEFTSRFRNEPAAAVVVADLVEFSVDSSNNVGHAIIIKAA